MRINIPTYNNPDKVFFTSDTHFGHRAIIGFCNRPFSSVEEMTEVLVENWNSVVGPTDTIYHLGDFAFGGDAIWDVINRLNGKKHLILGNHDERNVKYKYLELFDSWGYAGKIVIDNTPIYLSHAPMLTWGGINRGMWNLHGHLHMKDGKCGETPDIVSSLKEHQYDVGVDNNNYRPVSWAQILEIKSK